MAKGICKKTHQNFRTKVKYKAGQEYEIDEKSPGIGRFFEIAKPKPKDEPKPVTNPTK